MLITEAQMNTNSSNLSILNKMEYLSESVYSPAMVPIVENTDVQANLIRLEDLVSFGEANGIEDLGYALTLVCEADNVDPSTIAFTVQSANIIANEQVADLTRGIMEAGVSIYAVPVNENQIEAQMVDEAVNYLIETGDNYYLNAVANGDYQVFSEGIGQEIPQDASETSTQDKQRKIGKINFKRTPDSVESRSHRAIAKRIHRDVKAQKDLKQQIKQVDAANGVPDGESAFSPEAKAELRKSMHFVTKLKNGVYKSRDAIAKVLDRLNTWMRNIQDEIAKGDPEKRSMLTKLKGFIASAIEVASRKLHDFIQKDRGNIGERKNPLDN